MINYKILIKNIVEPLLIEKDKLSITELKEENTIKINIFISRIDYLQINKNNGKLKKAIIDVINVGAIKERKLLTVKFSKINN